MRRCSRIFSATHPSMPRLITLRTGGPRLRGGSSFGSVGEACFTIVFPHPAKSFTIRMPQGSKQKVHGQAETESREDRRRIPQTRHAASTSRADRVGNRQQEFTAAAKRPRFVFSSRSPGTIINGASSGPALPEVFRCKVAASRAVKGSLEKVPRSSRAPTVNRTSAAAATAASKPLITPASAAPTPDREPDGRQGTRADLSPHAGSA